MVRFVYCCALALCIGSALSAADTVRKSTAAKKTDPAPPSIPVTHRDQVKVLPDPLPSIPVSDRVAPVESDANNLKPVPATGRKHWELVLEQPADIDVGARKTVQVRELLELLRARHQFSLRMDIPTFSAMLGLEPSFGEPKSSRGMATYTAKIDPRFRLASETEDTQDDPGDKVDVDRPRGLSVGEKPDLGLYVDPSGVPHNKEPAKAEPKANDDRSEDGDEDDHGGAIDRILSVNVPVGSIDMKKASVATILRQALDALPLVVGANLLEMNFPMVATDATRFDYLVEDDGFLITTRMAALAKKEIRVYSTRQINGLDAEALSKIIQQTVRPWSWRSQINELGDQLRGSVQIPPEIVNSVIKSGVQLAAAQAGATVTVSEDEAKKNERSAKSEAEQLSAVGNAMVNGLVTFAHASLSGLQMFHHADFPTGTIQSLPGKLIVRQSQAAHREIADLLKQLSE